MPRAEEAKGAAVVSGEQPKIPAQMRRDLLRLRKQQASLAVSAASKPRPLHRLLRCGPKPSEPETFLSPPRRSSARLASSR